MAQEELASPLSSFLALCKWYGPCINIFPILGKWAFKMLYYAFFGWSQWLGNCKNDPSLQFLLSVPPLAVYSVTNSDEEETAAEAAKAHVKGRVHTIFSLYQKHQICRSIQRDVRGGHRVSFPSILYIKAVKKYRLRIPRECTVYLFLSAYKIEKDFAVDNSRYFWT